jgi:DNA-binding transcriptional LysR family regulator
MSPLFKIEPYRQELTVAVVSARHPLAKKKELTLLDVAQGPLIVRSGGAAKTWANLKQIEQQGYRLNILMECESSDAVKAATMKGMGLGFLYKDSVQFEVSKGELKILKIPQLRPLDARSFIIYDKRKPLSSPAQDFLDLLHEARDSKIQTTYNDSSLKPRAGI